MTGENFPEIEASMIYYRHLKRLHEEVMDMFRVEIKNIDGTSDGAVMNQVMKKFLHYNVAGALAYLREKVKIDELDSESMWYNCHKWLADYEASLPDSYDQVVSIPYTISSDKEKQLIFTYEIPDSIVEILKLMNGGRWQIEFLEMRLIFLVDGSM